MEEGLTAEERDEFLQHFHTLTEEACQFYHALFPLPGQAAGRMCTYCPSIPPSHGRKLPTRSPRNALNDCVTRAALGVGLG